MVDQEYVAFMSKIFRLRVQATSQGFTDKSGMERYFLSHYEKLVDGDRPSITEYGSGVPLLSLYLASQGRVDKIIAIENDPLVLAELDHVATETKLPIEVVKDDIDIMGVFPDTDVGVSLNCLYGFAPTFIQGASGLPVDQLPRVSRNVLRDANHQKFGLFRYMNNNMPWVEKEEALEAMGNEFDRVEKESALIEGAIMGFVPGRGVLRPVPARWGTYSILGFN